jgi:hypothetical protein
MKDKEKAKELAKKLEDVFKNKDSIIKVLEIIHLRQEERFLETRKIELQSKANQIKVELELRHKLGFIDIFHLISILESKDSKKFIEKWKKKVKKDI